MLEQIGNDIKTAMKAKDQVRLRSLRLIKSALMLLHTEGDQQPSAQDEMAVLIKMAKQRRDSIAIYEKEGREDLAVKEREELEIIEEFLPKQLSEEEVTSIVQEIVTQTGASSMADMGKVMGMATGKLKGQADGKLISQIVRTLLTQ